jgi:ribosomal protein S14
MSISGFEACPCGGHILIIDRSVDDYGLLLHCDRCSVYKIKFKECVHEYSIFKVDQGNGSLHIKTKCRLCGQHKQAHKKVDFDLNKLKLFDNQVETNCYNKRNEIIQKFETRRRSYLLARRKATNQWNIQKWYYGYLESEMWRRKREFILKRSENKCERCGDNAKHVHHKTYDRVGYEQPEDLMAVCLSCHGKEHSENPELSVVAQFKLHNL